MPNGRATGKTKSCVSSQLESGNISTQLNGLDPVTPLELREIVQIPEGINGAVHSGSVFRIRTRRNTGKPRLLPWRVDKPLVIGLAPEES
jgi:hypothetical protein